MPKFSYKAYTRDGRSATGELEAPTVADATSVLVKRGLTPYEAKPSKKSTGWTTRILSFGRQPGLSDYGAFARQAASLLESDMSIDQALKFMAAAPAASKLSGLAEKLTDDVANGQSLSSSFVDHALAAPPYFSSIIKAGEIKGNLVVAFEELAALIDSRVAMQTRALSMLTYPLILAVAAVATVTIVITILVPALLPLFEDAGVKPPLALTLMDETSKLLAAFWIPMLVMSMAAVVSLRTLLKREAVLFWIDRVRLRSPGLGVFEHRANTALFAYTLGSLLRAGTPLVPALSVTASVAPNRFYATALRQVATNVEEGRRFRDALADAKAFPSLALRLIAIGEETGRLDQGLIRLAKIFDEQNSRAIDKALTLLGPTLTALIGCGVGGLMLSVMNATLSVNQLVFK